MFETLKSADTQLFLFINGIRNPFFDHLMYWSSGRLFWLPLYALIAGLVIREFRKESWKIFAGFALLVTLSDQIASHLIKPWVRRLRPSHAPALAEWVHLSPAGPGGAYGFISSHAANAFALTTFLWFALPHRLTWFKRCLVFWAVLVSYSRIYNGVHYPADVLAGSALGVLLGWAAFKIFRHFFSSDLPAERPSPPREPHPT